METSDAGPGVTPGHSFVDAHDTEAHHFTPVPYGRVAPPAVNAATMAKGRRFKKPLCFQGTDAEWAQLDARQRGNIRKRLCRARAAEARVAEAAAQHQPVFAAASRGSGEAEQPSAGSREAEQPASITADTVQPASQTRTYNPLFRQPVPRGRVRGNGPRRHANNTGDMESAFGMDSDGDSDEDDNSALQELNFDSCPPFVKELARTLTRKPDPRSPSKFELSKKWVHESVPPLDRLHAKVEDFYGHKLIIWDPITVWTSLFPCKVLPCPRYVQRPARGMAIILYVHACPMRDRARCTSWATTLAFELNLNFYHPLTFVKVRMEIRP